MRLCPRPMFKPSRCAVIPYIGQTAEGERWIDTGAEMPGFDNHIYVSSTAVHEMAVLLGYPSPEEHARLTAANKMALELLDEMQARVEASTALAEAVAFVRAAAEPAPKPTRKTKAAA